MWAIAVRAARIAATPAPPGLPLSAGWLLNNSLLSGSHHQEAGQEADSPPGLVFDRPDIRKLSYTKTGYG
jgi:hypothetical protein